jgi:hypothetical protein
MKSFISALTMAGAATAIQTVEYTQEQLESMIENQEAQEFASYTACQFYSENSAFYTFSVTGQQTYVSTGSGKDMYFSLCNNLTNLDSVSGQTCKGDFYAMLQASDNTCSDYSTGDYSTSVLGVTYDNADNFALQYKNEDESDIFTVSMICTDDETTVVGPLAAVGTETTQFTTTMTGPDACSLWSLNAFFTFIQDYKWLFAIILMCIGLPFIFMGRKFFSCIVFVVGIMVTVSVVMILFYSTFLDSNTEYWVFWLVLTLSILGGCAVGFVLFKCQKLGAAVIAGWGGFLGGLIINTTFMFAAGSEAIFWIINASCALAAAAMAFCFYFPVIITVTSFSGSYMFIRGISLFAGGYPNEFTLINELENGVIPNMDMWFYLYLGFIVAFTILGMVVQCKHLKKEQEEKGEDNIHHPYANRTDC